MRYCIPVLLLFCLACSPDKKPLTSDFGEPAELFEKLQSDFMAWYNYHRKYTVLSHEFVPLDEENKTLDKKAFLKRLTTGNYIPLKLYSDKGTVFYKLYRLEGRADKSIAEVMSDDASLVYGRYLKQGQPFPSFHFTDLEGNEYTKEDLLGKIVFIKTWFVGCKPCVEEMTALNEMVDSFKDRDNMVFISLCLDDRKRVLQFLTDHQLDYAVVPDQGDFIRRSGAFEENPQYPTHVIINEKGLVEKMVSTYEELAYSIEEAGLGS